MPNNAILCDDGSDENSWCNEKYCGGKLIERKDGSKICMLCEHEYLPDATTLHKSKLAPIKADDSGPIAIPITEYSQPKRKKMTVMDNEEKRFIQQGRGQKILDIVEFMPGDNNNERRL